MGLLDFFAALGLTIAEGSLTVIRALFTVLAIGFIIGVPVGAFLKAIITRIVAVFKWLWKLIKK